MNPHRISTSNRSALAKHFPFDRHWLELPHGRMHYVDEGGGAPMLMLHGNPTWSFYWRELILALRDERRCVAPDHIGCGLSSVPTADKYDYRLASRVEDLDRLVRMLELNQKITLVVHDWGGMIGLAWAIQHPHRIERLIVLNTSAFHLPADKPLPWQLKFGRGTALGRWSIEALNLFVRGANRGCAVKRKLTPELKQLYALPYSRRDDRKAALNFVKDIPIKPGDPSYDLVSEVQAKAPELFRDTPTHVFWGMKDFVFDPDFLKLWRERFPNAEFTEFPDCGHYLMEDARDELISAIRDRIGVGAGVGASGDEAGDK